MKRNSNIYKRKRNFDVDEETRGGAGTGGEVRGGGAEGGRWG